MQDASYTGCRFDVIVPGTEVPNWFSHQHAGPSVIIELPSKWYNEKFKGLAVCLVLSFFPNFLKNQTKGRKLLNKKIKGNEGKYNTPDFENWLFAHII